MPRLSILYLVAWRDLLSHGVKPFRKHLYETPEQTLCRLGEFARRFAKRGAWSAVIDAQTYRILMEYGTRFADLPPMPLPLKKTA